jgi:hypothetical protein
LVASRIGRYRIGRSRNGRVWNGRSRIGRSRISTSTNIGISGEGEEHGFFYGQTFTAIPSLHPPSRRGPVLKGKMRLKKMYNQYIPSLGSSIESVWVIGGGGVVFAVALERVPTPNVRKMVKREVRISDLDLCIRSLL